MKLLFISHWANNMLIFRTWMLQEAVRRGHEVLVFCPADTDSLRFQELGVRHIPWKLSRGTGIWNMATSIREAWKVLRRENPDAVVVYCVQPILAVLIAWKLGRFHGKLFPTFTGLGNLWTDIEEPSLSKSIFRKIVEGILGCLLPQSEKIFVLNRDDKIQVASWNESRLSQKVVQAKGEGVDLNFFGIPSQEQRIDARKVFGIPKDAKVIGYVGRLIREKGALDFLQLCKRMEEELEMHFLVVGDADPGNPSSLTSLEIQALEALPRMHRGSWMKDVRPAFAAMDVLIYPSQREGLPVTPMEAMAMGVPVVAYDSVGSREVVPPRWLIPSMDFFVFPSPKPSPEEVRLQVQTMDRVRIQSEFLSLIGA